MKIALSAPADLHVLAPYFEREPTALPAGMGSTATTPLIAGFLERGHEVTLFTLSKDVEQPTIVRGPQLTAFVGPTRENHRARDFWKREVEYLAQAIRQERPAFVHAHWTYEFAMGALASGVPTITTIHDLPWNVLRYFRDPYRVARLVLAYRVARLGKRYTAVSTDAAQHFRRYMRPNAEITVIPNFLSDVIFAQATEAVSSPHPLTFYTVLQGWSTRKNAKAALRAFALTRRQLPESRLLMMGMDYQPDGLAQAWATRHGLQYGVEFRGPLAYSSMLSTVQKEADILVHPSLDESFSMAALEGMALHKPVIAGMNTPGVREVLEFGRSGLLVDVTKADAIAAAMGRLGLDPELCRVTANIAYTSAYRNYRAEPVLLAYEALYEQFVEESARKPALNPQTSAVLSAGPSSSAERAKP